MLIQPYLFFTLCFVVVINGQLLREDLMNLGTYNPETKKYEKNVDTATENIKLGGDDHDYKPHKKSKLGGDDHDYKPHAKSKVGGDDHDYKPHAKSKLGGDDHDYKPHTKSKLGGDDHDYKPHTKSKLGGDDHDYKPHTKSKLGGDDHDYKPHTKSKLGGDDHDYKPHTKSKLGGDDHDYKPHTKNGFLGGDDHDYKLHRKHFLGGDDHDRKTHKKQILGGDDHDFKKHKKPLLGVDGHDYKKHRKDLLGADDHDYKAHRKHLLGGDDHDYKLHKKHLLGGQDEHDLKPHKKIHLKRKYFKHHKGLGKNLKARPHLDTFQLFMDKFDRLYTTKREFLKRFQVFRTNLKKIKLLQQNELGTARYGITKFSDWTMSEFRKLLGLRMELKPVVSQMNAATIPEGKGPDEFDWRERGVVTEVKNQGMCGSCWAFSVTGNIEGQWALKHKQLYSLSEQELVDCDKEDKGCEGGLPETAYKAIEEIGGLETETAYPYEGKDDACEFDPTKIKVKVNGSVELPEDEEKMKSWLVKNGPISIGINANALQFYVGGVSHPFKFLCNPDSLDHGMLIVGYGVHTTRYLHRVQPYWLVKNSWGKDWGEKGYYRVYRGDGTCGVNKMATSAIVP